MKLRVVITFAGHRPRARPDGPDMKPFAVAELIEMLRFMPHGCPCVCRGVLVGTGTYARPWVRYELLKSFRRGISWRFM